MPADVADVLAARRRVLDALFKDAFDHRAPTLLRGSLPPPPDLSPEDGPHIEWLSANLARRRHGFIGENPYAARQYRLDYARYGGDRPYLDSSQRDELEFEYTLQVLPHAMHVAQLDLDTFPAEVRERFQAIIDAATPEAADRLNDLLLKDVWMVADILPPDPPPRPPHWVSPAQRAYRKPVADLLLRGPDADTTWTEAAARDRAWSRGEVRDALVDMATDPGLVHGWPADAASWAPFHALSLLGALRAHERAPALLALPDIVRHDDWISDHLFEGCLAPMGPEVEPLLWSVANDRRRAPDIRGLALVALGDIATRHPARTGAIAERLAAFVQAAPILDRRRTTVNAYAAFVLGREPFPRAAARTAIRAADRAGRLDHDIYDPAESDGFFAGGGDDR